MTTMDSDDVISVNGAPTLESQPSSDSIPHDVITTAAADEEELETPKGSESSENDTIRRLHDELHSLRRVRADLQRRLDEADDVTKSVAVHASHLEGELHRTQEDLASASIAAEDAENELKKLRAIAAMLKAEKEAVKERVKEMEEVRVSREEELGRVIGVMRERNVELEGEAAREKGRREAELEKAVRELRERNLVLEAKMEESQKVEEEEPDCVPSEVVKMKRNGNGHGEAAKQKISLSSVSLKRKCQALGKCRVKKNSEF